MCLVMWYNILGKVVRILKDNDFLNELMPPPKFSDEHSFSKKLSAALDEAAAWNRDPGELEPPPDYTEPLNRLNRNSEAANEELREINARFAEAKEEIKALSETVVQLRKELDEERERAKQAEENAKKFSAMVAILGASIGVLLSMIVGHFV